VCPFGAAELGVRLFKTMKRYIRLYSLSAATSIIAVACVIFVFCFYSTSLDNLAYDIAGFSKDSPETWWSVDILIWLSVSFAFFIPPIVFGLRRPFQLFPFALTAIGASFSGVIGWSHSTWIYAIPSILVTLVSLVPFMRFQEAEQGAAANP